ncbi:hypothetical protein J6590_085500 [Homalodisca vitripennis]|nr:hypothetical protein J6590_085500 [Homalodisca vitripennis]
MTTKTSVTIKLTDIKQPHHSVPAYSCTAALPYVTVTIDPDAVSAPSALHHINSAVTTARLNILLFVALVAVIDGFTQSVLTGRTVNLKKFAKMTLNSGNVSGAVKKKSIKDIEDLQSKIYNLSIEENLDHETSLTLAAELGSALLKENCLIKQQLHDLKETKSENLLELEDRRKSAEEIMSELKGNNQMIKEEPCFITSKLEEEHNLKQDFLLQAEIEKK